MSYSNIVEFKSYAFYRMTNLIEMKLPSKIKKINSLAFVQTSLPEIVFPASVEYIDTYATFAWAKINNFSFESENTNYTVVYTSLISKYENRLLRAIVSTTVFDTDVAIIGTSAFSRTNLEIFIAGPSLVSIDRYGFVNAWKLKKLDFSKCQINTLNAYALSSTPISSITIPNTVNSISNNIFKDCSSLKYVLYLGSEYFSTKDIFSSQNIKVFVTNQYNYERFGRLTVTKMMDSEIPYALMRINFTYGTLNVYSINKLLFIAFIII